MGDEQNENKLDIGNDFKNVKQDLQHLLKLEIDVYFEVDDWKTFFASLSSPLDMAKCLKEGAPQQLIKNLIENQFKIKWNTTTGEPSNYTYYQFCDYINTTALLTYKPRQAHVKATLYKECREKSTRKAITKKQLCPPVYIRTTSGWKTWKAEDDTFKDANFKDELKWMNSSIKKFIAENADKQKDDVEDNNDSLKKSLEKPTLYWAVLNDGDFIRGENLQLNEIGKTQVYVGKSVNGIKGRWIKDGRNHCAKMKRCLDNACIMTTYDPQRMKDIPLVDARLTLAKVRGEETALFLIKSFGDNVEKAKIAKQKVETGNEEAKSNNEEAEQECEEAHSKCEEARTKYEEAYSKYEKARSKYEKVLSKYRQTPSDGKRKETKDDAEETSKKAPINLKEKQETIKKEKKCVKKALCDAEKNHRNGKRVGDENLNITTFTYEMTWVPTNMGYGMNKC